MNHDHAQGDAVYVPCPLCQEDTCRVWLGCKVCLADAVSEYAVHILVRHGELVAVNHAMIGAVN